MGGSSFLSLFIRFVPGERQRIGGSFAAAESQLHFRTYRSSSSSPSENKEYKVKKIKKRLKGNLIG